MRKKQRLPRRGVAVVEFAVCLPLLVALTLGAVETANSIFLKQMLTQIAYEGARVATSNGGTQAEAEVRCQEIIAARGIHDVVVSFSPSVTTATPAGTWVTVTATAPTNSNSLGSSIFYRGLTIGKIVVMTRL